MDENPPHPIDEEAHEVIMGRAPTRDIGPMPDPDGIPVPTCGVCGEQWIDGATARSLDAFSRARAWSLARRESHPGPIFQELLTEDLAALYRDTRGARELVGPAWVCYSDDDPDSVHAFMHDGREVESVRCSGDWGDWLELRVV